MFVWQISLSSYEYPQVPKEHCKQVPKKVEKQVPRTKCRKVPDKRCQDFPINVPRKECKEFPKTVCTQVTPMFPLVSAFIMSKISTLGSCERCKEDSQKDLRPDPARGVQQDSETDHKGGAKEGWEKGLHKHEGHQLLWGGGFLSGASFLHSTCR